MLCTLLQAIRDKRLVIFKSDWVRGTGMNLDARYRYRPAGFGQYQMDLE